MANNTLLTDEYVADLVAKEAAMGLGAYRSARPASKLKPNTRFLRHIIKETKHHNEALLAKEAAEAQARLDDLAREEARNRRKLRPEPKDIRKRQLGDISAILQGRKRRRSDADDAPTTKRSRQDERGAEPTKRRSPERPSRRKHKQREAAPAKPHDSTDSELDGDPKEERGRSHRRRRPASLSDERRPRQSRTDKRRSRSPKDAGRPNGRRSQSPSGDEGDKRPRRREPTSKNTDTGLRDKKRKSSDDAERRPRRDERDDSDPLDDIIGPSLPPKSLARYRGRGAKGASSGIETRFSEGYDPSTDVEPESNGDSWEESLEAFRDRQKWKQQGASRLREAGFSDEQIGKWERSGREKDVNDVKWSKRGEGREWDRGKDTQDGDSGGRPDWARS